jgi:hypothetical protein
MKVAMKTLPHDDVRVTVKTVLLDITLMEWSVFTGVLTAVVVLSINLFLQ